MGTQSKQVLRQLGLKSLHILSLRTDGREVVPKLHDARGKEVPPDVQAGIRCGYFMLVASSAPIMAEIKEEEGININVAVNDFKDCNEVSAQSTSV